MIGVEADTSEDRLCGWLSGFLPDIGLDGSAERDAVSANAPASAPGVAGEGLRLRFWGGEGPSEGRFLHDRWRVPGRLSGPLRRGAVSYMHSFFRRTQLLQAGLFESQRIFRPRQGRHAMTTAEISFDDPRLDAGLGEGGLA